MKTIAQKDISLSENALAYFDEMYFILIKCFNQNKIVKLHQWTPDTQTKLLLNVQITQLTFTCSKSTTETLEKGLKYVQS